MPLYKHNNETTPLHLASAKGHLSICWILILSNENSLDAIDKYGNTPLHSAASNGRHEVLSCFLLFGADWTKVNVYRLTALQVAMNEITRNVLRNFAGKEPFSIMDKTKNQQKQRHAYNDREDSITQITNGNPTTGKEDDAINLQRMVEDGEKFGLRADVLDRAREFIYWIQVQMEILKYMDQLRDAAPTITREGLDLVTVIQSYLLAVDEERVTEIPPHISQMLVQTHEICKRSISEYELHKTCRRLAGIPCASESDRTMINALESIMDVVRDRDGDEEMLSMATKLLAKLNAELALTKSKDETQEIRLPVLGMTPKEAKSYWQADDVGHIQRTIEYPFPPAGGYIWIKSISLDKLEAAVAQLQDRIQQATDCSGNPDLIADANVRLDSERINLDLLVEKNNNDKNAGIADAEKAVRKARRKKKNGSSNKS